MSQLEIIENSAQCRRLSVKPGLTCLWQISSRNQITDFVEWVRLDFDYFDNWSLWKGRKILARTVPAVLLGVRRGAKVIMLDSTLLVNTCCGREASLECGEFSFAALWMVAGGAVGDDDVQWLPEC